MIVTGCVNEVETSFLIATGSLILLLPRSLVGDKSTSSSGTRLQLKTVDGSSLKCERACKILVRLGCMGIFTPIYGTKRTIKNLP